MNSCQQVVVVGLSCCGCAASTIDAVALRSIVSGSKATQAGFKLTQLAARACFWYPVLIRSWPCQSTLSAAAHCLYGRKQLSSLCCSAADKVVIDLICCDITAVTANIDVISCGHDMSGYAIYCTTRTSKQQCFERCKLQSNLLLAAAARQCAGLTI